MAVCSKFVILHADDADGAINIQNLLQNKFCVKSGIIFAVPPCNEPVLENLSNIVNGLQWTIMLSTKISELILLRVSVLHLSCQCF